MAKVGFVGWGSWASRCAGTSWRRGTTSRCTTGRRRRWDRWSPRGEAAASLADLVRRCDVTITMVFRPAAVRDVVTAKGGLLDALSPGKTYIDMTTVSPDASRDIARRIRDTGADYLEAPVLGAENPHGGTLVILTGGTPDSPAGWSRSCSRWGAG